MKYFLLIILCIPGLAYSQFTFEINGELYPFGTIADVSFNNEIKVFKVKKDIPDDTPKQFKVQIDDISKPFTTDGNLHLIEFDEDIRGKSITMADEDGNQVGNPFIFENNEEAESAPERKTIFRMPDQTAEEYVRDLFKDDLKIKEGVGLMIDKMSNASFYTGSRYIHIFLDDQGNNLLQSLPNGISRMNYVVHVIYLSDPAMNNQIKYFIKQRPTDIDENVVIYSEGNLDGIIVQSGDTTRGADIHLLEWKHYEIGLTQSTSNITFEIAKGGYDFTDDSISIRKPIVISIPEIKIKKVYHGSLDVGVLETQLNNPVFTLTDSDVDPNQKVVKLINDHPRIMASAMYTFYFSPIVWLESLFCKNEIPKYKLEGRNFIDDHKIYERIYPTVGIEISNRILDNIFIGGKWEFIRGGALFAGYHRGKVNSFDAPDEFEFSKSFVTQESFDLRSKTVWKGGFCIGLNFDTKVISNLFDNDSGESD